ncbi:hypothetical protein MMC10_011129 [Thelotrema lepadinum]|nr:hypothetical protein [Thelotrema lepadinum]
MKKALSSFNIPIRSSQVPSHPSYDFALSQKLETTKREKYKSKGIDLPSDTFYPEFSRDLCFVCRLFIGDIWTHDAWDDESLSWWSEPDDIGKSMFQHHRIWDLPADLQQLNCILCRMLAHGFRQSTQFLNATGPDPKYDDYVYIVRAFEDKNKLFEIAAVDSVPHLQFEFNVPIQYGEGKVDPHYLDAYCREHGLDDATPEDPGGEYSLLKYSGDLSVTVQIKEWMKACAENHENCKRSTFPLPTRVIDVGTAAHDSPRLYISHQDELESYLALSYCWGKDRSDILTQKQLEQYQEAIPHSALPATVFDAVQMTRSLGFRYLWVDALCIVQDSKEDWEKEAAKMRQVYQGAVLSLAGLESHSKTTGLFRDRTVRVTQTPFFDGERHLLIQRQRKVDLNMTVLRKRAWTLQEQILSPATVYFSGSSLVWECYTCAIDEDGKDHNFIPHLKWFGDTPDETGPHRLWYRLAQDYTARSITYTSDRVVAIAGLADKCEAEEWQLGSYLVGLWTGDLPSALLWKSYTRGQTDNLFSAYRNDELAEASFPWDIPSWSWLNHPNWLGWPDSFVREEAQTSTPFSCTIDSSRTFLSTHSKVANKGIRGRLHLTGCLLPFTDALLRATSSHDAPPYNELSFKTLKYLASSGTWRPSRPYEADVVQPWVEIGLEIGWKALVQPVYLFRVCSWPVSLEAYGADIGGGEYDHGYRISEDHVDTYFLVLQAVDEGNDDGTWTYDYGDDHYRDSFDEEFNENTIPQSQDLVDEYVERLGERRRMAMEERVRLDFARLNEMTPESLGERERGTQIPRVLMPEEEQESIEDDVVKEGLRENVEDEDEVEGAEAERDDRSDSKVDNKVAMDAIDDVEFHNAKISETSALHKQGPTLADPKTTSVIEADEKGRDAGEEKDPESREDSQKAKVSENRTAGPNLSYRESSRDTLSIDDATPTRFRRVGVFGFRHFKEDDSFMRKATRKEITLI